MGWKVDHTPRELVALLRRCVSAHDATTPRVEGSLEKEIVLYKVGDVASCVLALRRVHPCAERL